MPSINNNKNNKLDKVSKRKRKRKKKKSNEFIAWTNSPNLLRSCLKGHHRWSRKIGWARWAGVVKWAWVITSCFGVVTWAFTVNASSHHCFLYSRADIDLIGSTLIGKDLKLALQIQNQISDEREECCMYVRIKLYKQLVKLWNGRRCRREDGFLLSLFNLRRTAMELGLIPHCTHCTLIKPLCSD